MTINNPSEKLQSEDQPLIVGGGVLDYNQTQAFRMRNKKHRNIFLIVFSLIQLFIFLSTIYIFFIYPILTTNEANKNYDQPTVLPENEQKLAEKRKREIYQANDIEACNEFKKKLYRMPKESGGGATSYYYTCVYNISTNLKNHQTCISLKDDFSKRICLQALATVFKDPKYCQEADTYAREEVAKEQYSQAETDKCFYNINACNYIKNVGEKESCILYTSRKENVLNIDVCNSFADSNRKEECLEMVSVIENKPKYCQESIDPDNCYWSVIKITAPNLGKENSIIKDDWCKNISNMILKSNCLSSN